jgi:hypothetical protein
MPATDHPAAWTTERSDRLHELPGRNAMVDQDAPDPEFDVTTARLLRREALRRAAEELNTTSGPGLEQALVRISTEVTERLPTGMRLPAATPTMPMRHLSESSRDGCDPRMPRETIYLVQAFKTDKGARLSADTPIRCKSSDAARRTAENLATTKAGVVAFATSGDAELGEYDEEPTVIFKSGRLPAPFEEA